MNLVITQRELRFEIPDNMGTFFFRNFYYASATATAVAQGDMFWGLTSRPFVWSQIKTICFVNWKNIFY